MRSHVLAAAAMATVLTAFAQPAAAQQYRSYHDEHVYNSQQCERSRQNRTAGGAVIGGVIGALLGREVADRGVRGEGAGLGAVVGAVAGGAIGRSTARCDSVREGAYDPYYGRPYAEGDGYYRGDDDDLYGGPYEDDGYYRQGQYEEDCRMREQVYRDRYGRRRVEDVYMCRGYDGVWRRA
ncbi:MAG: YMGG-like glycine zipper-containing protein [Hyphomonadaceae bacterium]